MNTKWYTILADNKSFVISHDTLKNFPKSLLYEIVTTDNIHSKIKKTTMNDNICIRLDMDSDSVKYIISHIRGYPIRMNDTIMPKVSMDMEYLNIIDSRKEEISIVDKLASEINSELMDRGINIGNFGEYVPIDNLLHIPEENNIKKSKQEIINDLKIKLNGEMTIGTINSISNDKNLINLLKSMYAEDEDDDSDID